MTLKSNYYYDEKAAENCCIFVERHIRHVKGEFAGQTIKLEEWQKNDILKPLFGWKHKKTGFRKYRVAYIELPRKNAKSTLSAAIALILLFLDKEPGAEIYSAAGDRGQAGIVFDIAKQMVLQDPVLKSRSEIFKNSILHGFSYYQALSADSNTKHGFNAHGVIFDELHTQKNRDLWDTLNTSMGSRRQPLTVAITTAGHDMNSICREVHDIAVDIRDGKRKDETFLPVIYSADPGDDIYSEDTWIKANPGWGTTLKPEYIRAEAERAKMSPSYENTFKRLHLNIWTQSKALWIRDEVWSKSGEEFDPAILEGRECWGGLDLSSVSDLSAFTLIFPIDGRIYSLNWFWLPEEKAKNSADKNNLNYLGWVRDGYISETPGNVIDYDVIKDKIKELDGIYSIQSVGYDPYNSTGIVAKLTDEGFIMQKFRQGFVSMNYPMRQLERVIMSGEFYHNGNPVLRWMAGAVTVAVDSTGNQKISRQAYDKKVDGIVTNVMAYGQYLTEVEQGGSYLTDGEIFTL